MLHKRDHPSPFATNHSIAIPNSRNSTVHLTPLNSPRSLPCPEMALQTNPKPGHASWYSISGGVSFYTALIGLVFFDILLSIVILQKVPYTEIDWIAYMQEVGGFLAGERDYTKLKGDTGPLVYPAGFVYIYSFLHWLTDSGVNIFLAQCVFAGIYLITNALTTIILYQTKIVPLIYLPIIYLSKRLHSIYMLRCFNDCIAMLFMYIAVMCLIKNRWYLGSFVTSVALSIKMNILLFFPGLAILYLLKYPANQFYHLILHAIVIVGTQLLLGLPFLATFPSEYLSRSFEFSRVFTFIWTVNWKFLPEEIFTHPLLSISLLSIQLVLLVSTFLYLDGALIKQNWLGLNQLTDDSKKEKALPSQCKEIYMRKTENEIILSPALIVTRLVISNLIGIVCSRSLHYQFYSWYAHQLPLILAMSWNTMNCSEKMTTKDKFQVIGPWICFGVIEWTWNVFPSTPVSSMVWQIMHWGTMLNLIRRANKWASKWKKIKTKNKNKKE